MNGEQNRRSDQADPNEVLTDSQFDAALNGTPADAQLTAPTTDEHQPLLSAENNRTTNEQTPAQVVSELFASTENKKRPPRRRDDDWLANVVAQSRPPSSSTSSLATGVSPAQNPSTSLSIADDIFEQEVRYPDTVSPAQLQVPFPASDSDDELDSLPDRFTEQDAQIQSAATIRRAAVEDAQLVSREEAKEKAAAEARAQQQARERDVLARAQQQARERDVLAQSRAAIADRSVPAGTQHLPNNDDNMPVPPVQQQANSPAPSVKSNPDDQTITTNKQQGNAKDAWSQFWAGLKDLGLIILKNGCLLFRAIYFLILLKRIATPLYDHYLKDHVNDLIDQLKDKLGLGAEDVNDLKFMNERTHEMALEILKDRHGANIDIKKFVTENPDEYKAIVMEAATKTSFARQLQKDLAGKPPTSVEDFKKTIEKSARTVGISKDTAKALAEKMGTEANLQQLTSAAKSPNMSANALTEAQLTLATRQAAHAANIDLSNEQVKTFVKQLKEAGQGNADNDELADQIKTVAQDTLGITNPNTLDKFVQALTPEINAENFVSSCNKQAEDAMNDVKEEPQHTNVYENITNSSLLSVAASVLGLSGAPAVTGDLTSSSVVSPTAA